jgi:hypothetical protein
MLPSDPTVSLCLLFPHVPLGLSYSSLVFCSGLCSFLLLDYMFFAGEEEGGKSKLRLTPLTARTLFLLPLYL